MQNKEAIATLQQQIEGLRQDLALGHISKSEFGTERGKLLAQIDALDTRPNCMYSPEPKPGHFADPFGKLRGKLINNYNQARAELRTGGVYDESGCRVKFVEKELSAIYVRALGKVDKARSLPVLQRIQVDTANEVAAAMPFQKAA